MARSNFLRTFRNYGLRYSMHRAYQIGLHRPIRNHRRFIECVEGRRGIEIGGPSPVFGKSGLIPLYDHVGSLDNCNFAKRTLWAQNESPQFSYSPNRPAGLQFFSEGADLKEVETGSYEFILSSHMLEHTANPLRALQAWARILVPGGCLILLVPDKRWTFDHKRPTTRLEHLIDDFVANTGEQDLTHLQEILELHDLNRDPDAGDFATFKSRCENNFEVRGMHHHVFDTDLLVSALGHQGFAVEAVRTAFKDHIIAIARKAEAGGGDRGREP